MPSNKRSRLRAGARLIALVFCFFVSLTIVHGRHVSVVRQNASEARDAMSRASALRAEWREVSLRQAVAEYDKAASIWMSNSDFARASDALLKAGDVCFLFNDYPEALKRYQTAGKLAARDWLNKALVLGHMARVHYFQGNNDLAQQQIDRALELFKTHDANLSAEAKNVYGDVLSVAGEVSYTKGDLLKSSQQFESARQLFQNDREGQAKVHLFAGYIAGGIGDAEKAFAEISQALKLYRAVNNKTGEGLALSALGLSHSLKRDENSAIELHREAIKIFNAAGDRHSEAIATNGLGQVYENLNEYVMALGHYEHALQLFQDIGSLDGVSMAIFKLARVHMLNNQLDQALTSYERCLSLSRTAGKLRTEAIALTGIADIYAAQGRTQLALQQYQKVQRFYEAIGDRRGQVTALNARGDFLFKLGRKQQALECYKRAFPLSEKAGDSALPLATLYNLAKANAELGSLDVALKSIQQSIEMIEALRTNVASPEFRASYFSGERKHYELCIDILMRLDRQRPGASFAATALSVSEKSRARMLLDLLSESQASLRHGANAGLLDRERELRGLVRSLARYELELSMKKKNSSELADVTGRLAALRSEYQDVQAQLRERRPHLSALERFEPVDLQQIQRELRNTETLLLQYSLGDRQSYLWAVTADSFSSFELPPRKTIEEAATEIYKLLTARQGSEGQSDKDYQTNIATAETLYLEKAERLSRMLLGPVAQQLGNKKVLLVTEGALQYIPFDALPVPGAVAGNGRGRLLIETNEVDGSPSISTLTAIRAEQSRARSANKVLAVIADPVFSRTDDRIQSDGPAPLVASAAADKTSDSSVAQVLRDLGADDGPARLIHSSEEADAIAAAAPGGTTIVAKGFDATRETAMSPRIGEYQIVHFATHGFLNTAHPELSGILLTMFDRAGVERNGVMPLHDIYSLDLSAELTVLSACQTALGKDVRGEGLVGLTHSFMSAGSKSVVASLWKVDDRATASLMADFYHAMLQQGMPTGTALRAAKLKMMQDKRWNAPYFWAGFVLQGEYTNHIAVERSSWFSTRAALLLLVAPVLFGLLVLHRRRRRLSHARRV
jgi:CHAT domain-containing protein/tetratricopeptide (TPR) repeat protein